MVLVGKVSGLAENVNIWIVSGAMNVKLCMMVLLNELYLVIPLSVTLIRSEGYNNTEQF